MSSATRQMKPYSACNIVVCSQFLDQASELLSRVEVQYVRKRGRMHRVGDSRVVHRFLMIPRSEFRKPRALTLPRPQILRLLLDKMKVRAEITKIVISKLAASHGLQLRQTKDGRVVETTERGRERLRTLYGGKS
jgi:hypothetical protein